MKKRNVLLLVWFLAGTFAFSACQKSDVEKANISLLSANSPVQTSAQTPSPQSDLPIEKIDFKNFTYAWTKDFATENEKTFTLENGEIPFDREGQMGVSLGKIEYADVAGDGANEATLIISLQTGGTAVPNVVYVYTVENENPKLLWSFDTGDRAQGGLKRVYSEKGELVVETFGDSKFENDKWDFKFPEKFAGYCCPTAYTKIRFKWNGENFAATSKPKLFDHDWKKERNKNQ